MKKVVSLLSFSFVVLLAGCTTTTNYGDEKAIETVDASFGSTDLQLIAEKMVESFLNSPPLREGKPAVALGSIDNRTNEHIDTKLIMDKIATQLVQSGKVNLIVDAAGQAEIKGQISMHQSGIVSAATAKVYGKQVGADFVIYGRLANIQKKKGSLKDVYFNFNLNLVNVETAILEWKEEKEIRKVSKKSVFGW